jgi:hypothetical protein
MNQKLITLHRLRPAVAIALAKLIDDQLARARRQQNERHMDSTSLFTLVALAAPFL